MENDAVDEVLAALAFILLGAFIALCVMVFIRKTYVASRGH